MEKEIIRKCFICKESIDIKNEDYIKDVNYEHIECFRNKEKNKKRNRLSDEAIEIKIKLIKESMKLKQDENDKKELERQQIKNKEIEAKIKEDKIKALEKQKIKDKNKENGITDTINRNKFIIYIQSEYNITLLDKSFFIKLANINNGTYKGLKEGITYEDLLYMFEQKRDYLNKNADRMHRKGNDFKDNKSRLNYDVAVIINKYDAYKEWKEKQKLIQASNKKSEVFNKNQINYNYINSNNASNKNNKNEDTKDEININDIVDEI